MVYGKEDNIETDVEVDVDEEEEEQPVLRSDETVTPTSDILVRQKENKELKYIYSWWF